MKMFNRLLAAISILLVFLLLRCLPANAQGLAGLEYTVMAAGGATPTRTTVGRTVLATGVSPNINYDWGGGGVMGTNRAEGVLIRWTGFIRWPGSGSKTVNFYNRSDDGFSMKINDVTVIENWREQGPGFYNGSGSYTLTGGQVYSIEIWYYENGGGAVAQLFWDIGSGITIVPSTELATDSTFWGSTLCCGGSSAQFSANQAFSTRAQNFASGVGTSANGNRVYIEQIGSNNSTTVNQTGRQNYSETRITGSNNTVSVNQSSTNNVQANYIENTIIGSNNSVSLEQTSTAGGKGISSTINNNNNSVTVQQRDGGSHYVEINLSGGDKTVNVLQEGSSGHMTRIELSGGATSVTTIQSGSSQLHYSLTHSCATSSCSPISVTQGR
jgi:hypothetical protein